MNSTLTIGTDKGQPRVGRGRRDRRGLALLLLLAGIVVLALFVRLLPGKQPMPASTPLADPARATPDAVDASGKLPEASPPRNVVERQAAERRAPVDPADDPLAHQQQAKLAEIDARFGQAVLMLHAQQHPEALVALDRVLELDPAIAEAHVNRGYALFGMQRDGEAFAAFMRAIDLDPVQAGAYYGIALVEERAGNLEGALGGMRSFLHLSQDKHPNQIHVARARSAIWEWEAKLGRGTWGETGGIPPGFSEAELRRDGRGVGIKMPIPGTEQPDGSVEYEIKHQERYPMFRR